MRNIKLIAAVSVALFIGATSFMPPDVYGSWWWFAFGALIAAMLLYIIVRVRARRFLHLSLLLMIAGGMLTAVTSVRGTVHLRSGVTVSDFMDDEGTLRKLPFSLTLEEFQTEYYPGMSFPRDFQSKIMVDDRLIEISMNKIGREGGWRIYQQSFDGAGGSILALAHDPWGTAVTYIGFLMFAIAGFPMAFRRKVTACLAFLVSAGCFAAEPAERQVEFRGRIVPFATVASELTFKITGRQKVAGMNSTDFVISLMEHPWEWSDVPFIKTKEGYVSVASLYNENGEYLPQLQYEGGEGKNDAELLRLDEKVALLSELWRGELFVPASADSLRSDASLRAEVLYVAIQPVKWFFMLALAAAIIGLLLSRVRLVSAVLLVIGALIFIWNWYIRGYFPVAGTGEIMFFTSVCLCGCAWVLSRKSPLGGSLGLLMAGFAALLSWLAVKNPVMTPLMPVLASPWLSVHVSLIMVSYALLGMTFPLSIAGLFREQYLRIAFRLLPVGVYLLGLGIVVGAMWANVSWGRYWAWDPKETWALVTMLLYAIPLHPSVGLKSRPRLLSVYFIFAFCAIVMTYAGVNYLPSLHAYR